MPHLVLRFDMRNWRSDVSNVELYRTAIDMAAWADECGFDFIQFAEHHGSDDGYIPSPIVLASAIAARTKRVRLRFGLIILPLHHPIKLAEDLAVLDIVSGGRVDVVFGAGYARHEFEMFGVDPAHRGRLMEEGVAAVKQAWSGEEFSFQGRRAKVRPVPVQKPRPPIWLGGASPAAARRAARIADYFYTGEASLYEFYREEAVRLGHDPGPWRDIGTGFFVVTGDVDREWSRMAPYVDHEVRSYREWIGTSGDVIQAAFPEPDIATLRASGAYPILSPGEGLEYVRARGRNGDLSLHPLISGLPAEIGWEQLRRFEKEILPHVERPVE
jgi:alkanesulfonate monooxygenase SsuD/methylene tetrahydromethanopterin reductase-like flavin-dependent oxidoreductase (luciferase family)